MSKELAKKYDPKNVEDRIYRHGSSISIFMPSVKREKRHTQ